MGKWYRPSLTLANKCRIGFAVAVLLLIGGALCLPFIWMDKLVEQGRRELAQAEVDSVLERHFRSVSDPDGSEQEPPLVTGPGGRVVRPGRWTPVDASQLVGRDAVGHYVAAMPSEDESARGGSAATLPGPAGRDSESVRPLTIWRPVGPQSPAQDEAVSSKLKSVPGHAGRYNRPVQANRSCLAQGCHSGATPGAEPAEVDTVSAGLRQFQEGELVGVISVLLPAGQVTATLMFNRILIVVAGALAAIIAVVTFYLIMARFILQPVRLLREAADQITQAAEETKEPPVEQGESWHQAILLTQTIRTGDEFERLGSAFHHMLERLKLTQDRLRETNRALDLRLGELEAKNIALHESNKLKSEFLANVSHELRTPLNAILGFADILKDQAEARDDQKGVRYVSNVLDSGWGLLTIINNLLDLAKMEAGKVELHWEKCSIGEIAEALLNFVRPSADAKQLEVNLSLDERLGLIETDPGRLQQIMFNLLSNAIKFTPPGGRVELRVARAEDGWFRLQVSDTGAGIAQQNRAVIFEKFRQLDASVTRAHSGTGLGLAIVKELTDILGGSITVDDRPGGGTIFNVLLPTQPLTPQS